VICLLKCWRHQGVGAIRNTVAQLAMQTPCNALQAATAAGVAAPAVAVPKNMMARMHQLQHLKYAKLI